MPLKQTTLTCWRDFWCPVPRSRGPRPPSSPSSAASESRRSHKSAWTAGSRSDPARGPPSAPVTCVTTTDVQCIF